MKDMNEMSTDSGYVHTKSDKFEKATFFYPDRPSVHTKINLKTPAKCVSVGSENGTF